MNLSHIKVSVWKWIKRLVLVFLLFIFFMMLIAIFFGESTPVSKNNIATSVATGNIVIHTAEINGKTPDLANTGVSATGANNVPTDPLTLFSEEKKKEIYLKYREIQAIPMEKFLEGKDVNKMTDLEKMTIIAKAIHIKEEELAKENKLAWEDIDKVVGEAIQKGWNLEAEPKIQGSINKEDRQILINYIKDERGLLVVRCKAAVKERLKSPSSAEFPFSDYNLAVEQDTLIVKTYVDADNEFGANIRNTAKCYFDYNSGDATVKQVEIY